VARHRIHGVCVPALGLVLFAALALPAAVSAQPMTRCAICHFANMSSVPEPGHLGEWQQSAHARQQVGCDKCHGGDPWSVLQAEAHRGVVPPSNPASPVNDRNLVATCGACHKANAAAFRDSVHESLVKVADRRAPSCTTCHGAMRAQVPSPATLEQHCAECHLSGSRRGDAPAVMRAAVESLNALRARADALDDAVAQVPDHARRVELLVALYDARVTIKEAIARLHSFDAVAVNARLAAAKRQLDAMGVAQTGSRR